MFDNEKIHYHIVEKNEIKLCYAYDIISSLATFDIEADIVVTCFNVGTTQTLLARTWDTEKLKTILLDIININTVCEIRFIGNNNSELGNKFLQEIISFLNQIDKGRNIINIVSAEIDSNSTPKSFYINANSGKLKKL